MSNSHLYTVFGISLGIATVVVLLAAILLIAILLTARSILKHGAQALQVAESIANDTRVIWALAETNRLADEILATTESIGSRGGRIVEGLHASHTGL
ncbi:MAG: hypothetical protein NVSMB52_15620 [Chloroflexota bacterium]